MSAISDLAKEYADYDEQVIVRIECSVRELREAEAAEKQLAEESALCREAESRVISLEAQLAEANKWRRVMTEAADRAQQAAEQAEARVLAALREHFSTRYVVGNEIYAEIDAFEKEQRNDT